MATLGNFKFYEQTKLPNLYSVYGSFERSLIRKKHASFGYQLDFGLTYNPGRYDPVNNPGNNWLSFPIMAYFGAGVFARYRLSDYNYREYEVSERKKPDFNKGMQYAIVLGGGLHTCMAEWNAYVENEPDPSKKREGSSEETPSILQT